ncbi:MAG: BON domain-containing protein, partial [Vicinamibacterales bacterium]
ALACDLENRIAGFRSRLTRAADTTPVDDGILEARVRSKLGRASSHPGAIGVFSVDGVVTLTGPVLAHERGTVLRAVERVKGVVGVADHLTEHEYARSVPGLQGEGSLRGNSWSRGHWSPAARMLAVAGGATLIAYGIQQRTMAGGLAASLGAGLLSRGFAGLDIPGRATELLHALEEGRHSRAFDVEAGERGMLGI